VIVRLGQGKTANDESLARDEGNDCSRRFQVAIYKTAQGRQSRTPATAIFFPSVDPAALSTAELQRGARGSLRPSSCKITTRHHERQMCVCMCDPGAGDYHDDEGLGTNIFERPLIEVLKRTSS
jgi:hypothetical protein